MKSNVLRFSLFVCAISGGFMAAPQMAGAATLVVSSLGARESGAESALIRCV